MRRPSASEVISVSNSAKFSVSIRPLSLKTTSPFADLVIFSTHPLLRILTSVDPVTRLCRGNHSANLKLLKVGGLVEDQDCDSRKSANFATVRSGLVEEDVRNDLRLDCCFEAMLVDLQRPDLRL